MKERFKSLLLVFLVIMNFVLSGKILTEKKLWSGDYNFFSNVMNINPLSLFSGIGSRRSDELAQKSNTFMPQKFILNTGDQTTRTEITSEGDIFYSLYSEASSLLKAAFSDKGAAVREIREEDWYSALSGKSLYMAYPADYSLGIFLRLIGADNTALADTVPSFCDIIISLDNPYIYIQDSDTHAYYRISSKQSADGLYEMLEPYFSADYISEAIINYSFDLKFDRSLESQHTVLNPMVLIYSSVPEKNCLRAENPIAEADGSIDFSAVSSVLEIFDMNPNAVRRYTEAGGAMVFVENNAVMKLSRSGALEYQANGQGIPLSDSGSTSASFFKTAEMVNEIRSELGLGQYAYYSGYNADDGVLTFDYRINGLPVRLYSEDGKAENAVSAVIRDGCLVSYRQQLRGYTVAPEKTTPPEYILALDNAIAEYSKAMSTVSIEKMYLCYSDTQAEETVSADWAVEVDNIILSK